MKLKKKINLERFDKIKKNNLFYLYFIDLNLNIKIFNKLKKFGEILKIKKKTLKFLKDKKFFKSILNEKNQISFFFFNNLKNLSKIIDFSYEYFPKINEKILEEINLEKISLKIKKNSILSEKKYNYLIKEKIFPKKKYISIIKIFYFNENINFKEIFRKKKFIEILKKTFFLVNNFYIEYFSINLKNFKLKINILEKLLKYYKK